MHSFGVNTIFDFCFACVGIVQQVMWSGVKMSWLFELYKLHAYIAYTNMYFLHQGIILEVQRGITF